MLNLEPWWQVEHCWILILSLPTGKIEWAISGLVQGNLIINISSIDVTKPAHEASKNSNRWYDLIVAMRTSFNSQSALVVRINAQPSCSVTHDWILFKAGDSLFSTHRYKVEIKLCSVWAVRRLKIIVPK